MGFVIKEYQEMIPESTRAPFDPEITPQSHHEEQYFADSLNFEGNQVENEQNDDSQFENNDEEEGDEMQARNESLSASALMISQMVGSMRETPPKFQIEKWSTPLQIPKRLEPFIGTLVPLLKGFLKEILEMVLDEIGADGQRKKGFSEKMAELGAIKAQNIIVALYQKDEKEWRNQLEIVEETPASQNHFNQISQMIHDFTFKKSTALSQEKSIKFCEAFISIPDFAKITGRLLRFMGSLN